MNKQMKREDREMSEEGRKRVYEFYFKAYYLMYGRKKIEEMAEEAISKMKWYERF